MSISIQKKNKQIKNKSKCEGNVFFMETNKKLIVNSNQSLYSNNK